VLASLDLRFRGEDDLAHFGGAQKAALRSSYYYLSLACFPNKKILSENLQLTVNDMLVDEKHSGKQPMQFASIRVIRGSK